MLFKDYYKILGVKEDASEDEIKKKYRELAMLFHPDRNQGDKKAGEKFREIAEAYDVLSDKQTRTDFDNLLGSRNRAGSRKTSSQYRSYTNDFKNPYTTRTVNYQTDDTMEDVWKDFKKDFKGSQFSEFFKTFFDKKESKNKTENSSKVFKGKDIMGKITIDLNEAYSGSKRILKINGEKLRLTVKPGIENDQILKVKGKGNASKYPYGEAGDLFVRFFVKPHKLFKRKQNDLYMDLNVDIYTIMLGGEEKINSLKGNVSIKIPAGTPFGKTLRLKRLGMPIYNTENSFGDLYVKIKYSIPKNLSKKELDMLKELYKMNKK